MLTTPVLRRPSSPPRQGGGNKPARRSGPANDNAPRHKPSNDNLKLPPRETPPISPGRLAALAGAIVRRHPALIVLNLGLMIYNHYNPGWAGKWLQSILLAQGFTANTVCLSGGSTMNSFPPFSTCGTFSSSRPSWDANIGKLRSSFLNWVAAFYPNPVKGVLTNIQISLAYSYQIPKASNTEQQALEKARKAYRGMALNVMPLPTPDMWPVTMDAALVKPGQAPALAPPVPLALNKYWKAPNRVVSYGPRPLPIGQVPNDWSVSISPKPNPKPAPHVHTLAPPGALGPPGRPKDRETKRKMSPMQAAAIKAVSSVTEGLDLLNALYDSLPPQYRPRYRNTSHEKLSLTPTEKMRALIDNADHIDMAALAKNVVMENVEDQIYGRIGQVGGQISRRLGIPYGGGLSPISRRFYDSFDAAARRLDGEQ